MAKNFVFTVNNPHGLINFDEISDVVDYLHYSEEQGDEGTNHLQGYLHTINKCRFSKIVKLPGLEHAHVQIARGTVKENYEYVSKTGKHADKAHTTIQVYGPFGTAPQQGQRTDIKDFIESIKSNKRDRELIEDHPVEFAKYPKLVDKVREAYEKPRWREPPIVYLLYGPSNTGKTTYLQKLLPDLDDVYFVRNGKWWNGYTGQSNIIIEDMNEWFPLQDFLNLVDKAPLKKEIKGGFTPYIEPKHVLITANILPTNWWKEIAPEVHAAILKRINTFCKFNKQGEAPLEFADYGEFIKS